jgi:hypothetical protein
VSIDDYRLASFKLKKQYFKLVNSFAFSHGVTKQVFHQIPMVLKSIGLESAYIPIPAFFSFLKSCVPK